MPDNIRIAVDKVKAKHVLAGFSRWLTTEEFAEVKKRMAEAPVHKLENVDGDIHRVRTACGSVSFIDPYARVPVSELPKFREVTCFACLEAMADEPTVVEARDGQI